MKNANHEASRYVTFLSSFRLSLNNVVNAWFSIIPVSVFSHNKRALIVHGLLSQGLSS